MSSVTLTPEPVVSRRGVLTDEMKGDPTEVANVDPPEFEVLNSIHHTCSCKNIFLCLKNSLQ